MIGLTPDITNLAMPRHGTLRLTFADGLAGEVDVLDRMHGPVFDEARTRRGSRRLGSIQRSARCAGRTAQISRLTRCTSACAPACGLTRPARRRGLDPASSLLPCVASCGNADRTLHLDRARRVAVPMSPARRGGHRACCSDRTQRAPDQPWPCRLAGCRHVRRWPSLRGRLRPSSSARQESSTNRQHVGPVEQAKELVR